MLPLAAAAAVMVATPPPRPLAPGAAIRATLAGGESILYSIDVPPDHAARVIVYQEGIDVSVTLRRDGAALEHGLDMRAGVDGDERAFVPISPAASRWNVLIKPALPHAARGDFVISLDVALSDDATRALAVAFATYQQASDDAWGGDAAAFTRAKNGYAAAAAAAEAAGDPALAAEAIYQLARIHDNLGDQPGAIDGQRRALAAFRALGRRDREARVLNRLGDLSRKVGEVVDAEAYFKEALPLARETSDPVTVADILNNSGLLMLSLGRTEEAIEQLRDAIPLAQEVDSANVEAALTANMADGYLRLGVYDTAIETYRRAVAVVDRLNIPRRSARTRTAMAEAQFQAGQREAANATLVQAKAFYDRSGDRNGLAELAAIHGMFLYESGEADRTVALFAEALPTLQAAHNRAFEAEVLATWASADADRGDGRAALTRVDEALQLARAIANPAAERFALYVRARALQRLQRLDEAQDAIAAATRSIEAARGAIQRYELRTSYLARVRSYFDLQIDLLQQRGDAAGAFETAERARARTLLDGLAESAAKIRKGVDPDLLARQRTVQARLNAKERYRAQIALADGEASARATAAGREVARLLDEWNALRASIRTSSPSYAQLQAPEPVTLDRVQHQLLDGDTTLVEYHLGAARSYAWIVDRESVTAHQLPAAAAIDAVARPYHELLSRDVESLDAAGRQQRAADVEALGRRLAAMIWTPIEARAGRRRLLIVGDGVLQYVPFAALPAAGGEPLIVNRDVVYLPSASVLGSIRQRMEEERKGRERRKGMSAHVAVFADPVFSRNDPRFAAERDAAAPAQSRAGDGALYGRLRFSRREAEAIVARAPDTFQALDFLAAKQTLESRDLRRYRILHFATHGSLNAEHPELSGLVLSLVDAAGRPTDGFLRLHEIYNLNLNADLVVLSACRTALGREVHGEGLIGLTRGFMYAGASRVVSSVWNVDDRASAQLMARFYDAMLARGRSPAGALREAQLAMLHEARWADPHYWAAFALQGDWK